MRRIAMFTMGTLGDVQPYLFLSKELARNGYEVTLGSHPCWKDLIESSGIRFVPIGPDIDITQEAAIIRGKHSNPAVSMLKTMDFVLRIIQESTHQVHNACKGKDLIVVSHSLMGAVEAGVLGIPTVNVTLQKEMIGEKLKYKSFMGHLMEAVIEAMAVRPYNRIRKVYGLKPVRSADKIMSQKLNLLPISEYVLQRNPYWEKKNVQTGYWYDEQETDFVPNESLERFLREGERPILLALGAMSFEDRPEKDRLDMFVSAFQKTGHRAVIQGFRETLRDYKLPTGMIAIGSVPHSWLFRQCQYVIHHSGFGTTASTLIWGIPSITVPHVLDQMGFARQLFDNHVSTRPLKASQLTEKAIIKAIEEMDSTLEEKMAHAKDLSLKLQSEKGVTQAVLLIQKAMGW